jgi:hypothetical protein
MKRAIIILFVLIMVFGCRKDELEIIPIDIEIGWFPETPINIVGLNTTFDDYNSDLEGQGQRVKLYYSTNYPNKGANFDITGVCIDVNIPEENNGMTFYIANDYPNYSQELLPLVNSTFNEFGPFSFHNDSNHDANTTWYFFYANDEKGQFNIKFAYTSLGDWGTYGAGNKIHGPFNANVLNSDVCDFYPTINSDRSKMFFSSYRKGEYDIYEIETDNNDFINWLATGKNSAILNETLSSAGDDKCPYIKGNLMVFASDNPNGYGGYDLWYSVFEDGRWTMPQNFGPEINSKYDEFRPAIEYFPDSNNDLMIFSSNRTGGKGGFDLYFAGIQKMIN